MKKILSFALAVIIVLLMSFPSYAEKKPVIIVENVNASDCKDITVNVYMENNPGLISMRMSLNYDKNVLTLTGVSDGTVFGTGHSVFGDDLTASPYVMLWVDELASENYTDDGIIATLTFSVNKSVDLIDSEISVELDEGSVFDYDLNDCDFDIVNGTVSFTTPSEEDLPVIFPENAVGQKGQIVDVPVMIKNNPGMIALMISLSYDTNFMTLEGVSDRGLLGQNTAVFGDDYKSVPYKLIWEDGLSQKNYSADGELVILSFRINPQTTAESSDIIIDVIADSTFDADLNDVNITTQTGTVSLGGGPEIYLDGGVFFEAEDIEVTVNIKENPGIISTLLNIDYDSSVLELITVENGDVFPYSCFMCSNDKTIVPYKLIWEDGLATGDNCSNGVLAVLKFRVINELKAEGSVINISYDSLSTFNAELNDVSFATKGLTVKTPAVISSDDTVVIDYLGKYIIVSQSEDVERYIYPTHTDFNIRYIHNSFNIAGTESRLIVVDSEGKTVEEYIIVVIGDTDGDGYINGMDSVIDYCVISEMLSETEISKAVMLAADYNSDGIIDNSDYESIRLTGLFI